MSFFKFFSAATLFLSSTITLASEYACPPPYEIKIKGQNTPFLELSAQKGEAKYAGSVWANDGALLNPKDLKITEFESMTYFQNPGPEKKQAWMTCRYKMMLKAKDVASSMSIIGMPNAPFNCKTKNNSPMGSAHNKEKVITCRGPNLDDCIFVCP